MAFISSSDVNRRSPPVAIQTPDRSGRPADVRGTGFPVAGAVPLCACSAAETIAIATARTARTGTVRCTMSRSLLLTADAGGRAGYQLAAIGECHLTRGTFVR